MGGQCCSSMNSNVLTLDDHLSYIEQEDIYLRQTIDYNSKQVSANTDPL